MGWLHELPEWPAFFWDDAALTGALAAVRHRQGRHSKYAKLARCSTDTALRDLRDLLARGIMVRNPAGGRSTSYRLAPR